MKDSNGVTMIALVITIVVMLIIASVTIYTATNSGILSNTKEMSSSAELSNIKENIKMDILAEKNKHGSSKIKQEKLEEILKKYVSSEEQLVKEDNKVTGIKLERNKSRD